MQVGASYMRKSESTPSLSPLFLGSTVHERRRSRVPAGLANGIVLSSTGSHDLESKASVESTFRKINYILK